MLKGGAEGGLEVELLVFGDVVAHALGAGVFVGEGDDLGEVGFSLLAGLGRVSKQ